MYTADATGRTYQRLFALARIALRAGWPVVLDAAFLKREERSAARALADAEGVPFTILACEAPQAVLQERLRSRRGDASEADLAVLAKLGAVAEALDDAERAFVAHP
ncbi:AAA family ATPase [Ramlibacter montanisoli]|uniref:AAA family ATPase n=1 Tax=Ramlibacter montanisoli TaxID=2732512 RepID=UPI0028157884|nr:ATP-binding protein [Ramlibacter montanisoli]